MVSGRGGRGDRGEGFPGVRGHPRRRRSSRRSSAGGLDVLPERVIIQAKRLGRRVRPVLAGRFHRQGLKFLGDTRAILASPPPTIETPPNRRQPNGDVVCGSGSHLPSSTQSCADSRRYQTLQDDSMQACRKDTIRRLRFRSFRVLLGLTRNACVRMKVPVFTYPPLCAKTRALRVLSSKYGAIFLENHA